MVRHWHVCVPARKPAGGKPRRSGGIHEPHENFTYYYFTTTSSIFYWTTASINDFDVGKKNGTMRLKGQREKVKWVKELKITTFIIPKQRKWLEQWAEIPDALVKNIARKMWKGFTLTHLQTLDTLKTRKQASGE